MGVFFVAGGGGAWVKQNYSFTKLVGHSPSELPLGVRLGDVARNQPHYVLPDFMHLPLRCLLVDDCKLHVWGEVIES